MSAITTHVLDTAEGRPAAGIPLRLERRLGDGSWSALAPGLTDPDGRASLLPPGSLESGVYRLTFETAAYFAGRGAATFYPYVTIVFEVRDPRQPHHVPLLLSPFGYSTYRGS
jgi:5-hydroxyisourate hydrolase